MKYVRDGVYRGPKPATWEQVKNLHNRGIKTILNLDLGLIELLQGKQNDLARWCQYHLNIKLYDLGLSSWWAPKREDFDLIRNVLRDESLFPIYVCCRHGRERTGLVIADDRMRRGWPFEAAYSEMKALGCRIPQRWIWKRFLNK